MMKILLNDGDSGEYFTELNRLINKYDEERGIELTNERRKRSQFIQKEETANYQNEFSTFPLEVISIQNRITIDYSFFELDIWGKEIFDCTNSEELKNSLIAIQGNANEKDNRAKFLWCKLSERYQCLTDNYQKYLPQLIEILGFQEGTSEEIITINLIRYYKDILKNKNAQLKVFEDVIVTKEIADTYTQIWIAFFEARLKTLNPKYIFEKEAQKTVQQTAEATIYELPENFSLLIEKIKADSRLDIKQSAILFHLLRKHEGINNYSDKSLAKIVHYLTGHSEQNLRTKKGFGAYWSLINETRNDIPNFNLLKVKEFLQDIIADINEHIEKADK